MPLEAYGAAPAPVGEDAGEPGGGPLAPSPWDAPSAPLSADERMQAAAERELLCALAQRPDALRRYEDRIASLSWSDERLEAMAWAMLSTPEGTSPADVVAAATAVVAEAPQILSGGRVMDEAELSDAQKLDLIVDTAELLSCRRRIRQIRARLGASDGGADSERLFEEAAALQRRTGELSGRLSSVSAG